MCFSDSRDTDSEGRERPGMASLCIFILQNTESGLWGRGRLSRMMAVVEKHSAQREPHEQRLGEETCGACLEKDSGWLCCGV